MCEAERSPGRISQAIDRTNVTSTIAAVTEMIR